MVQSTMGFLGWKGSNHFFHFFISGKNLIPEMYQFFLIALAKYFIIYTTFFF